MSSPHLQRQHVVVTGLGAITPLGSSVELFWDGIINGRSGIRRITQFDASEMPCQIAGEIPDFDVSGYMERKEARRYTRSSHIALAAASQSIADAGLPDTMPDPERAGVIFGTGIGGVDRMDEGMQILRTHGLSKINPFFLPSAVPNIAAYLIARQFQCLGPNSTIVTSCATGTQVVGEGAELIRSGRADIVVCGGTEAQIQVYSIGGFSVLRALPVNYNDDPERASRPFDAAREGFVFSEGAGALVLENLEHAKARGARIYAEVLGHASSNDGYHIIAPDPEAMGPTRAMRWALRDAGIDPQEVDYINAHGTSTPLNDETETRAIKMVFGDHAYGLRISSIKSMIGHPMGASGTLEAIACVLAIVNEIIPPTINYERPDPECDLDYVPNEARKSKINTILSNSFGVGGQNACLVLKRYEELTQ